jgi:hypothetical protein
MASCLLEILELDELYKRKQNLLLQLFLVDKEIKKRMSDSDNLSIIREENIKEISNITDIKKNNVKKITIRIKK